MSLKQEHMLERLDHMQACFLDFRKMVEGGTDHISPDFCKGVELQGLDSQEGECVMIIRVSAQRTIIDVEHCTE